MSAPNLTIQVQPAEASSVVYGALAAKTSNDESTGQLSLVLTITNHEPLPVHLNKVSISFVGPPSVSPSSITADLTILPNQTSQWYFPTANNIILPVPAPGVVKLSLYFDLFSDPANVDMPLAQYVSPATNGGYSFPAKSGDLKTGEVWTGQSAIHGGAGGGTQMFAYDLVIRAYDSSTNSWPTAIPGTDVTKNENYHVWGKPIYAIADGVVVQFRDGIAANTPPGFPSPTPNPVEGNHFYIQHGTDLALYAHFQAGTLNPSLTSGPNPGGTGATVASGQLLGLAGNSGNSSEPHLHTQINRTTIPWGGPPRPLTFNGIYVLDLTVVDSNTWPPTSDKPWNKVSAEALPSTYSAIWPGNLLLGKTSLFRWLGPLAWAWIIIIGALMITPGGVDCIACGRTLTNLLGLVSIGLGVLGIASGVIANRAAARQRVATPRIDVRSDLHG